MSLVSNLNLNWVGSHLLPYNNAKVVAPPGVPDRHGRSNIVVATPKRSGTHLLMDILLNNLSAYRTRPLYIDLDKSWRTRFRDPEAITRIDHRAGYILKSHLPSGLRPEAKADNDLLALIDAALVIVVKRDKESVVRSLQQWSDHGFDRDKFEEMWHDHWTFWDGKPDIEIEFSTLFDDDEMVRILDQICESVGVARNPVYRGPVAPQSRRKIYLNKIATRLLGARAPRVDTTIHTLKG
jgi:hypothetical protein